MTITTSSASSAPPQAAGTTRRRSPLAQLTRVELLLFWRERVGPIWGVGFPMLLLVIFGAIPSFRDVLPNSGGLTVLASYIPILVIMALALLCMVSLPVTIVNYRERGVLRRLRTTPAGPMRVLGAQFFVNFGMAAVTVAVILVVARLGYGVPFPQQLGAWVISALFVSLALLGMGLFIAAVGPTARAAGAIGNLIFYPMMFFGGLWLPIPVMPQVLQHISHATPLGAGWEAFQQAILGHWPPVLALVAMAAWAVVSGVAAVRFFRWE